MDPEVIQSILDALLGGGGVIGVLIALRTYQKMRKGDVPKNENDARLTADWVSVNAYFQQELATLRGERDRDTKALQKEIAMLRAALETMRQQMERQADDDEATIDALQEHIWLRLPPPPPPRKGVRASDPPR